MKLLAKLEGGTVIRKAWSDAVPDQSGWTDISEFPFVMEGDVLSTAILNHYRKDAIRRIELGYASAMLSGFTSSALGTPHWYASDGLAMPLLVGAAAAGTDMKFECTDGTGTRLMPLHTAAQLRQVLNDGAGIAVSYKQKKRLLFGNILAATTVDAVNAITW